MGSDPSELLGLSGPSEPLLGENSDEASESTLQLYNLHVRKRAVLTELLPSAKRSCLDMEAHLEETKATEEVGENVGGEVGKNEARKVQLQQRAIIQGGSRGTGKGSRGRQNIGRKQSAIPVLCVPIIMRDSVYKPPEKFCPLRDPGPYLPENYDISALSLFKQFFDEHVIN